VSDPVARDYIQLLSEAELQSLRKVLGRHVSALYTRSVDVFRHTIIASVFSLGLGGQHEYCVIESDWNDTPTEYLDYHEMHIDLRDWPKRVVRARDDRGMIMLGDPSTVHLPTPASPIVSVDVHECRKAAGAETVHYDHALVFGYADGYRFSLAAHQSIRGGLEFSDDSRTIAGLVKEYRVRVSVRA
jgi:hypothetical protein